MALVAVPLLVVVIGAARAPERIGEQAVPHGRTSPSARVLFSPTPVLGTDARRHLVYEILLRNPTSSRLALDRLEVRGPDASAAPVASFAPRAIAGMLVRLDPRRAPPRSLLPGQSGVLFVDVGVSDGARVPRRLSHRFLFSRPGDAAPARVVLSSARVRVRVRPAIVLGPPLRGANLLDANGCCGKSDHTRALNEIGDRPFLAERFAIDFVRVGAGNTFHGDPT